MLTYGPCTVSGGFAIVQPDSVLSINAVEGFPLEDFSGDVSRSSTPCTKRLILTLPRLSDHRSVKLKRLLGVVEVRRTLQRLK